MENTVSTITQILIDVLIGTFSLSVIAWTCVAVQTFFNDKKEELRRREKDKRDAEYHLERMKELRK
jgi:beta-lactamase regulating signal transducer with metallopeptidase domain